jgi:hypothetical protein
MQTYDERSDRSSLCSASANACAARSRPSAIKSSARQSRRSRRHCGELGSSHPGRMPTVGGVRSFPVSLALTRTRPRTGHARAAWVRGPDACCRRSSGSACCSTVVVDERGASGERNRQFFDRAIANQLPEHADDPLAFEQAGASNGGIEQAQHVPALQRQHPLRVDFEFAGGIDAADQRVDGSSRDGTDRVAVFGEPWNHADVSQASGSAAAQNERYGGGVCRHGCGEKGQFRLRAPTSMAASGSKEARATRVAGLRGRRRSLFGGSSITGPARCTAAQTAARSRSSLRCSPVARGENLDACSPRSRRWRYKSKRTPHDFSLHYCRSDKGHPIRGDAPDRAQTRFDAVEQGGCARRRSAQR